MQFKYMKFVAFVSMFALFVPGALSAQASNTDMGVSKKQCEKPGMVYQITMETNALGALSAKTEPTGEIDEYTKGRGTCLARYCLPSKGGYGPKECNMEEFGSGTESPSAESIGGRIVENELSRIGEKYYDWRALNGMPKISQSFADQLSEHFSEKASAGFKVVDSAFHFDQSVDSDSGALRQMADKALLQAAKIDESARGYADISSWIRGTYQRDTPAPLKQIPTIEHMVEPRDFGVMHTNIANDIYVASEPRLNFTGTHRFVPQDVFSLQSIEAKSEKHWEESKQQVTGFGEFFVGRWEASPVFTPTVWVWDKIRSLF